MELNFTRWLSGDLDIILLYNRECYSTLKSTCKVCTVTVLIASLFSFLHALVIYDNFPKQRRCQYSQKLCSNVPNTTRLTVVFRSSLRTLLWHTYLTSSGRSAAYGPYKRFDIRLSPWSAPQSMVLSECEYLRFRMRFCVTAPRACRPDVLVCRGIDCIVDNRALKGERILLVMPPRKVRDNFCI